VKFSDLEIVNSYEFNPSDSRGGWKMLRNPGNNSTYWATLSGALNCSTSEGILCRCSVKRSIVKTACAYIDSSADIPGEVFDEKWAYPTHPFIWNISGDITEVVEVHPRLANGLSVYGSAFAHVAIEILPQILHYLDHVPSNVPILVDMAGAGGKWVEFLNSLGITTTDRWISLKPTTTYFAKELYFQIVEVHSKKSQTATDGYKLLREEGDCSWRTSLPNDLMRQRFCSTKLSEYRGDERKLVVVLDRKEVKARSIANHDELLKALKVALPGHVLYEYIGREHTLRDSINLFCKADVLIAPHGAGLIYMQFLSEHSAVIEIGYESNEILRWPVEYYAASALVLNLRYYPSVAVGGYITPLHADINDVVSLAKAAVGAS